MSSPRSLEHFAVKVAFDRFEQAAAKIPAMKRAPAGARSSIPKDTLLAPDPKGIRVETPSVSTLVTADHPWIFCVSVDARRLAEILKLLRDKVAPGVELEISYKSEAIWLVSGAFRLSVPGHLAEYE